MCCVLGKSFQAQNGEGEKTTKEKEYMNSQLMGMDESDFVFLNKIK